MLSTMTSRQHPRNRSYMFTSLILFLFLQFITFFKLLLQENKTVCQGNTRVHKPAKFNVNTRRMAVAKSKHVQISMETDNQNLFILFSFQLFIKSISKISKINCYIFLIHFTFKLRKCILLFQSMLKFAQHVKMFGQSKT